VFQEPTLSCASANARSTRARLVVEELVPPSVPLPKRMELGPRPKSKRSMSNVSWSPYCGKKLRCCVPARVPRVL
jgi:hypothetical protein